MTRISVLMKNRFRSIYFLKFNFNGREFRKFYPVYRFIRNTTISIFTSGNTSHLVI